jgi:isochorismate synthase
LGELNFDFENKDNATDLYVNLRCVQIQDNLGHIYVGGGITIDSNAESEWQETVNKSQTINKILYLKMTNYEIRHTSLWRTS